MRFLGQWLSLLGVLLGLVVCLLHVADKGAGEGFRGGKGFGLGDVEYIPCEEEEGGIIGGFPFFGLFGGWAEDREGLLPFLDDPSRLLPLLKASHNGDSFFLEVEEGGVLKGEGTAFDGAEASELVG